MSPSAVPLASEGDLTFSDVVNTIAKAKSPNSTTSTIPAVAPLDASRVEITRNSNPRAVPAFDSAERRATSICSDHMVTCSWLEATGWDAPKIKPYGPLEIMPTASCLHYATECFEGLKLYRGYDGKLRLFRPERNAKRMLLSAARIALPAFDPQQLLLLITKLCAVDGPKWLPYNPETGEGAGEFLYIRPTMIADDPALGVQKPKQALLYVILNCFAKLDAVPGGMRLLASEEDTVRAWPGGFGYAKVGANYGPTLAAQGEARRRGFQQVLWLLGRNETDPETGERLLEVTEAGASNFFVVWRNKKDNALELVTAPLGDRVILDGVTRRSVLEIAEKHLTQAGDISTTANGNAETLESLRICEKKIYMSELLAASRERRLVEAFASGTAFFIAPVSCIGFRGEETKIPMGPNGVSGEYTAFVKDMLTDIMYGRVQHEWGYVIKEE